MKPLKSDFPVYTQFSLNIEDRLINPHIEDAYFYTIRGKIGYSKDSTKDLAVAIHDTVLTSGGTDAELFTFYEDYILRWWVLLAYKRFLQNHGRNVTQFGYTTTSDPDGTFTQVDAEGRAVLLRQLQSDINVSETNVFLHLNKVQWTFDKFKYLNDSCVRPSKSFGISPIGAKRIDDDYCDGRNYYREFL